MNEKEVFKQKQSEEKQLVSEHCRHDFWEKDVIDLNSVCAKQGEHHINVKGSKNRTKQSDDDEADEAGHGIYPIKSRI